MDWLTLGIIIGCAVMLVTALALQWYRKRLKADEEARKKAQEVIDEVAAKSRRKKLQKVNTKSGGEDK